MAVPKATMHKNYFLEARENEVRTTWKIAPVQAIAITKAMNKPPDEHLGTCVAVFDQSHALTALLWRQGIVHGRLFVVHAASRSENRS